MPFTYVEVKIKAHLAPYKSGWSGEDAKQTGDRILGLSLSTVRWKKLPELDYRHMDLIFHWINLLALMHLRKAGESSNMLGNKSA